MTHLSSLGMVPAMALTSGTTVGLNNGAWSNHSRAFAKGWKAMATGTACVFRVGGRPQRVGSDVAPTMALPRLVARPVTEADGVRVKAQVSFGA